LTRKRPLTAQEDLAEARRRAKAAKTPIAKTVTKQVLEAKERTYSGRAADEIAAQMPRTGRPRTPGTTPKRRGAWAKRGTPAKAASKTAAPKRK
jgi:uncharacterized protein (DUF2267 family)